MMKKIKRFISSLLVMSLVCLPMSVSAKESIDPSIQDVITGEELADGAAANGGTASPLALGNVIASGTMTIYGGSDILTVTLPSGNWFADLRAGIAYAEQSGVVRCTVLAPDGNHYNLGTLSGSGSSTGAHQITYAPAGEYKFYFESGLTGTYKVVAYIHD